MSGREIKAWLAFLLCLATILAVCFAMYWPNSWPGTSHSGEIKYVPVAAAPIASAPALVGPVASDAIIARIQSNSASDRQAVIDGIWRLAARQPSVMADHLLNWYGPLMEQKQYADVEGLSLLTILKRAWWYPQIATCQEARVRAFLAEGQYPQALAEAKSYYNIAPLTATPTAIDLLAQALAKTRGSEAAEKLRKEERAGNPILGLLKSIKVDDSRLKFAISMTRPASAYPFDNQISQGNLLLLADRPLEAEQSFIKACDYAKKDWDLPKAIEGIARSVRDQDGSLARARLLVHLIKIGQPTVAAGITLPANLKGERLREAATEIDLSAVPLRNALPPPRDDELAPVDLPAPSSEVAFDLEPNNLPVNDPVLLARLATQGDPNLRTWMERWQRDSSYAQAVTETQREELTSILAHSKLPTLQLLKIANAVPANSIDKDTLCDWLTACAGRADSNLADWLQRWRQATATGISLSEADRAELTTVLGRTKLSCELLAQIGAVFNEASGDSRTTAVFFGEAVSRGHKQLSGLSTGNLEIGPVLRAMKGCESVLWECVDMGELKYVDRIDDLSRDIQRLVLPGDAALAWAVPWAKIDEAECVFLRDRSDGALANFEQAIGAVGAWNSLTNEQKITIHWIEGLAYENAGQYDEAVPHLRIVADNLRYANAKAARVTLFMCLLAAHHEDEARQIYQSYSTLYGRDATTHYMQTLFDSRKMMSQSIIDAQ